MPGRFTPIEIVLLSVGGIMLAFFATAHVLVAPTMLESLRETGLILAPLTQLTWSTKGLLLVEVPGVALLCVAAISLRRGQKRRGGVLAVLCILEAFFGGLLLVYSLSLVKPSPEAAPTSRSNGLAQPLGAGEH